MRRRGIAILTAVLAAACSQDDSHREVASTSLQATGAIGAAIADPARPVADRDDDPLRKPNQVLAFAGVEPGMAVFEIEAGRGYYTELLSRIAGPAGRVVIQNPAAFDGFAGEALSARLADNRLPNVRRTTTDFDDLQADDASIDLVTWFLGPHELYYQPPGVEDLGDPAGAFLEIRRILKPGGTLVILDHAAAPGAPAATGGETHRIDPAIVKRLAAEAGFEFVAESEILRNPNDDYALGVFDPNIRRRTDRFLLKYRRGAS